MTEKEVEKAYKKMTESDAPDLWAKIESNLPEKEVRTEKKVRTGFFAKLGKIFSGGSTWKTSAAVCAVCIIVLGTAQGAGGMFRAGASNGTASAASKSSYGMDAYSVDGAEAYSAEGDGEEAAPADYNGMNYAAAAAGTGADADSSGGAVVLSENEASAAVGTEVAEASADEALPHDSSNLYRSASHPPHSPIYLSHWLFFQPFRENHRFYPLESAVSEKHIDCSLYNSCCH